MPRTTTAQTVELFPTRWHENHEGYYSPYTSHGKHQSSDIIGSPTFGDGNIARPTKIETDRPGASSAHQDVLPDHYRPLSYNKDKTDDVKTWRTEQTIASDDRKTQEAVLTLVPAVPWIGPNTPVVIADGIRSYGNAWKMSTVICSMVVLIITV
jgi:hypothetical protein